MKIAIIGAGINGLAVAVNLLETYPNFLVTIFSDRVTPNTTGDVSAGLWKPYAISEDDVRLGNWCQSTHNYLKNIIITDPNHHEYGIFFLDVYDLSDDEEIEMTIFQKTVDRSSVMNKKELERFPTAKYGVVSCSIVSEGGKLLSHLYKKFIALKGMIRIHRAQNFDEIQMMEDFKIVINCSGLGARELCKDPLIYPVRGQVIRVEAPWIKSAITMGNNYIIPQSNGVVVLGGTAQANNWDLSPSEKDTKDILEGCTKILPGLKNTKFLSVKVGLRPRRNVIRLEKENRINEKTGSKYEIIHNYGHGGSGFTLFWGCSEEVLRMVSDILIRGKL